MRENKGKNFRRRVTEAETIEAEVTTPEPSLVKRRLSELKAVFAALSYRDYRYFWVGAFLSSIGTWLQMVALGWLVYEITHSAFILGFVNFASSLPVLIFSLPAGVAADRYNRKNLIIITQIILMASALLLGIFTSAKITTIEAIVVITFIGGVALAFNFPAWQAIVPDLVPPKDLLNGIALNSAQFNAARFIGPALAGAILAKWGAASCFYLNGVSFLAVIIAFFFIHPHPNPKVTRRAGESIMAYLVSGIRYIRKKSSIGVLLLTVGTLTIFGYAYNTLMPVFAKDILHVGPTGLGFLFAASGVGAVGGALIVSYLSQKIETKSIVKTGPFLLGLFLLAFSFSKVFLLSIIFLAGVGSSFLATLSATNTLIQASIPNEIRGRIMSLYILMFMGMMPLSSLIFGSIAEAFGAPFSVAIGAGVCLITGLILSFYPKLLAEV